jgi:hypothetical protein
VRRRKVLLMALAAFVALACGAPALADQSIAGDSSSSVKTAPLSQVSGSANSDDTKQKLNAPTSNTVSSAPPQHVGLGKRIAGVAAGLVVGIPVSAVRQPLHEEKYGISQTAGEKARPRKSIPWAVLYSPFALVSGLIEAPFYALDNCLVNSDRPFSKAQMSIGDREEPLNIDPIKGTSDR